MKLHGLTNFKFIFVMSVRPSFRIEQLGYHWTGFHKISYLSIIRKICLKYSSFIEIGHEYRVLYMKQSKAIPLQAWTDPEGSRRLRLPDFKTLST